MSGMKSNSIGLPTITWELRATMHGAIVTWDSSMSEM